MKINCIRSKPELPNPPADLHQDASRGRNDKELLRHSRYSRGQQLPRGGTGQQHSRGAGQTPLQLVLQRHLLRCLYLDPFSSSRLNSILSLFPAHCWLQHTVTSDDAQCQRLSTALCGGQPQVQALELCCAEPCPLVWAAFTQPRTAQALLQRHRHPQCRQNAARCGTLRSPAADEHLRRPPP